MKIIKVRDIKNTIMKKTIINILVWTPLGLYIYPKYFWNHPYETSDTFKVLNGALMGFYFMTIILGISKYF